MKFSANLGFLWKELSLPKAITAAASAGFHAVECHWPYNFHPNELNKALSNSNIKMLSINTQRGNIKKGDNGLLAVPGREKEAIKYIDEALEYAKNISCKNVHVMAGRSKNLKQADDVFIKNINYAVDEASKKNINILIEPLNHFDAPNYYLSRLDKAVQIIEKVNSPNLKIMFDCYHIQLIQGNLFQSIKKYLYYIGHIQIASVPDRNEPDKGEVNFRELLRMIVDIGYDGYFGAEYKPLKTTNDGLRWMKSIL